MMVTIGGFLRQNISRECGEVHRITLAVDHDIQQGGVGQGIRIESGKFN